MRAVGSSEAIANSSCTYSTEGHNKSYIMFMSRKTTEQFYGRIAK